MTAFGIALTLATPDGDGDGNGREVRNAYRRS